MSKLTEILDKYRNSPSSSMKVGIMGDKTYPDGELVAQVGFTNEYGSPKDRIPPRPFFRTTISNEKDSLKVMASSLLSENDLDTTLRLLGEHMTGALQDSVMTWSEPPNAQSTIDEKGYNAPLRANDRLLRNSFSYEIEND